MDNELVAIAKKYVGDVYQKTAKTLEQFKEDYKFISKPRDLSDYPRHINALEQLRLRVYALDLKCSKDKVKEAVLGKFDEMCLEYTKQVASISDKFEARVDAIEARYTAKAKEHNDRVRQQVNEDNEIYLRLEQKRRELERYKSDIIQVCEENGITSSDVSLDNNSFEPEELEGIYDSYIKYMKNRKTSVNPITRFRDCVRDNWIIEAAVLLLCVILMYTVIFNFVSLGIVAAMVIGQMRSRDVSKSYGILMGLVFNINPLAMGFSDEVDTAKLLNEHLDEDNAPELQAIADEWAQALDEFADKDPMVKYGNLSEEFDKFYEGIQKTVEYYDSLFAPEKVTLLDNITDSLSSAENEFEKAKQNVVLLGHSISESLVFNTVFKLGLKDSILEETVDIGLRNVIIYPGNTPEHKAFLQVMFANALCNVRPDALTTYIYDPNTLGQSLGGFYTDDMKDNVYFENDSLEEVLKVLKEYAETNMKQLRGQDITTYNQNAVKTGMIPKEYKLLIILSQPKKVEEDEALREFMKYSAKLGVLVWVVTSNNIPDTKVFKRPFEGIEHPYRIDLNTFADMVNKTWVKGKENMKIEGLPWREFQKVAIPEDKWWTWHADKYVDLDPGFWEGDPSKYQGYQVGHDGNIHALAVGTTGAGKSIFLNQLIINICCKYSPRDVELWLVDYKCQEFGFYLPNEVHPKTLPHIKACLCTTDGDYAGSLYTALRKETERRNAYIAQTGYKSLYQYNTDVRKGIVYKYLNSNEEWKYITEPDERNVKSDWVQLTANDLLPRILFINDEFQVIFKKAETNIVEKIRGDLEYVGKIGRAVGVHMLFTSQSMQGTLSGDILNQFSLRFALRCEKDVSKDIMGSSLAGEIKQKFGYLYVRDYATKEPESQRRYRTPFLSEPELRDMINKLADMAEAANMPKHDIIAYSQEEVHRLPEIDEFYEEHQEVWQPGLILLGRRMTYSDNKSPENLILAANNNTHIMSVFEDNSDLVQFYKSIRENLIQDKSANIFVNSQVADFHYICEIDKDMPEELQFMSNEKYSVANLVTFFSSVFKARQETNKKDEPCYYILIGWDKAVGFGVDRDYSLTTEFATLLQLCGEFNMHFIFILSSAKGIAPNVISACQFRICGKCNEDSSYSVLESKIASKNDESMKNGYMYLNRNGKITRCMVYRSKLEREVKSTELII